MTADWHWESDWYDFTIEAETPDGKNTNSGIARLSDIKSIPYSERFSVYYTFILNERLNPPAKLGRLEEDVAGVRK